MEVIPVSRSGAYKRTDVKKLNLDSLRERALELGNAATAVGLDIGKNEMVA